MTGGGVEKTSGVPEVPADFWIGVGIAGLTLAGVLIALWRLRGSPG